MKILKGKSRRTKIFALITFAVIVVLFGLNLGLSLVGLYKSVYVDMTPEGLYTVTDKMIRECSFIDEMDSEQELEIIFCNDPDNLMSSTVTRVTYFMALKLESIFDNVNVREVNVNYNPTAVSKYKATSLSTIKTSDVIVAYGDRYRIVGAESFWTTGEDGGYFSYNGEYKLATLIKSVTLANDSNPTAYFVTGHGESIYDPNMPESVDNEKTQQLKNLLTDRGFKIKVIDLDDENLNEVPDDCALLIINNPQNDFVVPKDKLDNFFYVSALEKIDRYLTEKQGALMVAKAPEIKLEAFENFLSEWGFALSDSTVMVENTDSQGNANKVDTINSVYSTDTESYAYAIYGEFAALSSAPSTVFSGAGYIECSFGENGSVNEPGSADIAKVYSSFLTSPTNAAPYSKDGVKMGVEGAYDLAAVTTRTVFDGITAEYTYSYVFCANDGDFFSNELLGNAAYANFDIMSALINNMSRVDIYASSELGGTSLNAESFGGKQLVSTTLSTEDVEVYSPNADELIGINFGITTTAKVLITVFVALVPIAVMVVGIIVFAKRKYM